MTNVHIRSRLKPNCEIEDIEPYRVKDKDDVFVKINGNLDWSEEDTSRFLDNEQLQIKNGAKFKRSNEEGSQLNECLSVSDRSEVGVCFGKELLNKLNDYDETDSFSLVTGVSFVRDEKLPRDIGNFLDKDPMDFRSIIEDASSLISKRSLHWDLGKFYPGLVMRIGPTLANGILEFVIDPRAKDRSFVHGKMTTGRLLTRNLLLPFLLGIKFHITTLLPLLLGLLLLASKKAFLLAKLAVFAVTLFTTRGTSYGGQNIFENFLSPSSSYLSSSHEHTGYNHGHHGNSGGHITSCSCSVTKPTSDYFGNIGL
ncbi:jg22293 [Pararge aegeria aegeria]|uniref:Jg22293 protein n=1 Tax=Pararge aegeria aegeria TaxID=348720 RepID=A0A8S4SLQ5_9NEOP|nr:jg22293 [Pararge aegeria aegeria]